MKQWLLPLSTGLLLALGWPTYGLPLLLFGAFVPLLIFEYKLRLSKTKRKAIKLFIAAYLGFVIWNTITTSWLWFADPFGCLFAILVNSALMASLMLFYQAIAKRSNAFRSLLFLICLWMAFEKLHLGWEFSWPWLNLGNAFSEHITWIQWYEFSGTFGGTLWVWIANAIIFSGWLNFQSAKDSKTLKKLAVKLSCWILIPIGISTFMYYSYQQSEETVTITVLQPNIDPYEEKYSLKNSEIADLLLKLSNTQSNVKSDFILAPETVFADNVYLNQLDRQDFIFKLRQYQSEHLETTWLTGISFIDVFSDPSKVKSQSNIYKKGIWYDDYNSAIVIKPQTDSILKYHKSKLVVGVENFPYQSILRPLIGDAMIDLGGTVAMKTTQKERSVFEGLNPAHRIAPIICYESVYGEFVTEYVRNGASVLGIITNDAWWGDTQGHKQHLSYARLRAIETRRSIARSANTGISAFISPRGDLLGSLPYDSQGALTESISLETNTTFYVIAGDYLARIAIFIAPLMFLIIRFRRKRPDL